MNAVAVFAKPKPAHVADIGGRLVDWLNEKHIDVHLGKLTALQIERKAQGILDDSIPAFIDLVIVLGGDGTILRVARMLESYRTPVMAVNIGGLGFLAGFTPDELFTSLADIIAGHFMVSRRSMLHVRHFSGSRCLHEFHILNDVVIKKSTLARIIRLETHVDAELITTYLGDGLIVSSPTGSTGYSLSAAGPIIYPHMKALVLTPICPHTLTHRPIVISAEQTVEVILASSDSEVLLTIDGQVAFPMAYRDRVEIKLSPHHIRLVQNPETTFFKVLCHKLKWGQR